MSSANTSRKVSGRAGSAMPLTIPLFRVFLPAETSNAVKATLDSGQLAQGDTVAQFETRLAQWLGAQNLCAASDFSGALTIALYAAGVRPNDEVILSPLTCLATSMPVCNLFAKPVWCDIDPTTGMMDATHLSKLINAKTRAILVYHWSGDVADIDAIRAIAKTANIPLIEDVSESFGAEYQGAKLGAASADFSVFSFGPVRQLTCGEGAAIVAASTEQADLLAKLRRYGINKTGFRLPNGDLNPASDIPVPGFNFPMSNLSAAIGISQFDQIDANLRIYRDNGAFFHDALKNIPGVTLLHRREDAIPSYWTYSMRVARRDDLIGKLIAQGIGCQRLHLRNDHYSCFDAFKSPHPLPGVEVFDGENLSIPCGWWVGEAEREKIVDCFRGGW
ncbi:MAG: DegT/DnrJ/EryC1/StrS family aminotransferase [Burkholderiales bacterium]